LNTDRAHPREPRPAGFTLIEVMASLAILGVSLLGLMAGLNVASASNGRASRRTQMVEFAQSRIERLMAATKADICTATFQGGVVDCSRMAGAPSPFNPNVAPNTGGWMLDVLDRAPYDPAGTTGVDPMAGPVVVLGNVGGSIDEPATLTARASLASDWSSGGSGCASPLVTKNMLCRELHIELDSTSTYYHIWVRVSRGQNYGDGPVVMEGMVAK
jgi:prepilin-type N-terminal cleavage/methylation domain-containing protein